MPDDVTDRPQVSVVMAVRNAERYLAQALDSVAAQTFQNYEVVVVDGASSDDSVAIARSYPRTTCIRQGSEGFANAWNIGIEASRTPFVAFLDSDDIWPPHKLEKQTEYFARMPTTDCVIGHVEFFLEPGLPIPSGFKPALLEADHVAYMPGASMIRRSVFDRIGRFEEHWRIASDIVWFSKLRTSGLAIGVADDVVLRKRVHDANLSYVSAWPIYRQELTQLLKQSIDRRRAAAVPTHTESK